MDVKKAIEVLRAEGQRRHRILRDRVGELASADDAGTTVLEHYQRNSAETKAVYSKLSRMSHALRALSMFDGEV